MLHTITGVNVVLYVDDEEMARKYFERTFSAQYKVLTAADADSALAIVKDSRAHVGIVVSDYRMPRRSGGDLLRQIAREFPHIIRILVTAYADREMLLETVNTGEVFRILEKPLNDGELAETLRLASDLLRMRNARLQRLQAIDETLSFLAHELNTPLAAILNFAQGMQDRLDGGAGSPSRQAELKQASIAVGDNARYCLTLLASFLETVRGADGQLSRQPVSSAHELILSFLDAYPLSPSQRGAIRVEVAGDFTISALPNCVSLVLSSLLGNALRALKESSAPAVTFKVSDGEDPYIRITDNGPGIPPAVRDRLTIDPATTNSDSGGTGWGLIFSSRIMRAFGGSIDIQSQPGAGTAITLHFPPATARSTDIP
jgi:two-component system, response regulator PhcR